METTKPMTWDNVAQRALNDLSAKERQDGVAYLDENEIKPGSSLKIDGTEIPVRNRSAMVFVDREPQANWGHSCRYMLIDLDSGNLSSYEAQLPPFLRSVPKTLRLIHKGPNVPDWAVVKP
jgi:hypothetical protein